MSNFRRMLMMLAQDLPKRESFQYGDEILSQDAYDYALSFGKKVVKDLKKVIDASENPALLIKRINDWKYLIHSLVDTGYTSWLKGDGNAYINSEYMIQSSAFSMEADIFFNGVTSDSIQSVFGVGTYNGAKSIFVATYSNNRNRFLIKGFTSTSNRNLYSSAISKVLNKKVTIQFSNGYFNSGETEYNLPDKLLFEDGYEPTIPLLIFAVNKYNDTTLGQSEASLKISRVKFADVNKTCVYVPYFDTKRLCFCMIDIENAQLYYNADQSGSAFSWSLTDSDNNDIVSVSDDVIEYASLYMDEYQAP